MKVVSDKSQLAVVLDQDIRVAGEHTEKGTVMPFPEGQARHLIACNKAHAASEEEIKDWNEKEKEVEKAAAKKAMSAAK